MSLAVHYLSGLKVMTLHPSSRHRAPLDLLPSSFYSLPSLPLEFLFLVGISSITHSRPPRQS